MSELTNYRIAPALILLLSTLLTASLSVERAYGQSLAIMRDGGLAVSGLSRTEPLRSKLLALPARTTAISETLINHDGTASKVFDISHSGGPPQAQLVAPPVSV